MTTTVTGFTGTTSTSGTCAVGDRIVVLAFRDGNTAPPTIPGSPVYNTVYSATGANTCSHCVAEFTATATTFSTGTFTNATSVVALVVHTDVSGGSIGLKNGAPGGGSSTTLSFTGFTLDNPNGTSKVLAYAGHRSTNTTTEAAPTGFTNVVSVNDATDEASGHVSTSVVSSFSTTTQSVGGTSSGWRTHTLEVWEIPPDTTAPTLSSPTGTAVGSNGYSGTVSTNEGNGTLFRWVTQNSSETASDVVTNGASQAVTTTGTQNVSGSGLSASTTYYIHYVHVDAATNQSSRVSSSSFTTSAAGTGSITLVTHAINTSNVNFNTLTSSDGWAGEDWAILTGASNTNNWEQRKSGGGSLIGNITAVSTTPIAFADSTRVITGDTAVDGGQYWVIETPTPNISFPVPAGVGEREVRVYPDVYLMQMRVTAALSDASASPVTSSLGVASYDPHLIVFKYKSGSPGQTLTLKFENLDFIGGANIAMLGVWLSEEQASSSVITASTNATLAALTTTSSASSNIAASSNATLAALTTTSSASSTVSASSNISLAALTSTAAANVADGSISANTNATLAPLTSTSSGSSIVAGTSNATLAPLTSTAAAASIIGATSNRTLAPLTSTGSASSTIAASANATLAPLTSAGSASSTITASSNATLAALTSSAFANLADGTLSAFLNKTLAPLTSTASASSSVLGGVNKTLAPLTVSGQASSIIAGTANRTLAGLTSTGSASMVVVAGAGITLDELFSNAQAQLLINAGLTATLAPLSSQGAIGELLEWDGIPEINNLFMPGQFGLRLTKAQHALNVYPVKTGLNLRRLH